MLILSLDSSSSNISFCLLKAQKLINLVYKKTQEKTLNLIPHLFNAFNINPKEIDAFYVSIGIGYATPLKIGINILKAMAISLEKPIYTFTNIDAVAKMYFDDKDVFLYRPVSNAYVGAFYKNGLKEDDIKEYKELPKNAYNIEEFEHMFSYIGYLAFKDKKQDDIKSIEPIYTRPPTRVF